MKNKLFLGLAALSMSAILFTSCAKLPQAEIDAANAAIDSAKAVQADLYVPANFVALQDSMNAVMVEVEAQKSKLFKKYTKVSEGLVGVTALAQEVKVQAVTRKEEVKVEATNTIAETTTLIEANRELLKKAPKGKEGAAALAAMKDELDAIEVAVAEATATFDAGDLLGALDKAKAAKDKATSINTELNDVIAKYKARR